MKNVSKLKWVIGVFSLAVTLLWLTGCGGGGGGGTGNDNNGGGTVGTNAPATIAGNTITHAIASGTGQFTNSTGTFVLQAGGSAGDVTGPYTIAGSAGAQSSNGTYTWSANGNTATLSMQDSVFGSLTETLTFQDPSTGTYTRTAGAGTENGTFTLP